MKKCTKSIVLSVVFATWNNLAGLLFLFNNRVFENRKNPQFNY